MRVQNINNQCNNNQKSNFGMTKLIRNNPKNTNIERRLFRKGYEDLELIFQQDAFHIIPAEQSLELMHFYQGLGFNRILCTPKEIEKYNNKKTQLLIEQVNLKLSDDDHAKKTQIFIDFLRQKIGKTRKIKKVD